MREGVKTTLASDDGVKKETSARWQSAMKRQESLTLQRQEEEFGLKRKSMMEGLEQHATVV